MKNRNSTIFLAVGVMGMIIGILTVIVLIGIPIIIGASRYLEWAKMSDEQIRAQHDSVVVWGIVYTIFLFPLGALALIPLFNFDGQISQAFGTTGSANNTTTNNDTDAKMEKIKKLYDLKEKGIIDEEDFKAAKEKILKE